MFCVTCLICNSIKTLTNLNSSKKHCFVYLQEKCMNWKSSFTMKQLFKVNTTKEFIPLMSMIFVIILFWNWIFLPKWTFAWSSFIILSSSYIALSPLKKKQQNIFFLKLQCEKEGENAIKHKYFMSKIHVRKKFNDQRLLRKE